VQTDFCLNVLVNVCHAARGGGSPRRRVGL